MSRLNSKNILAKKRVFISYFELVVLKKESVKLLSTITLLNALLFVQFIEQLFDNDCRFKFRHRHRYV